MLPPSPAGEYGGSPYYGSTRELCARPTYGGSITEWSTGAYCASGTSPPTILFQRLPPGGAEMSSSFRALFAGCQYHCRCVAGDFADPRAQGRPATQITEYEAIPWNEEWLHQDDHRISDPLPARPSFRSSQSTPSLPPDVSPIPIYFAPEVVGRRLGPSAQGTQAVTTVYIIPVGGQDAAPTRPGTFDGAKFGNPSATVQQMCAAEWFGGSKRGNAGFFCRFVPSGLAT
jgi:hypothetical protein